MKKVVIIGGAGTVGKVISAGLSKDYEIIVMDSNASGDNNCIKIDATNYDDLMDKFPRDTDCIINLLKTDTNHPIEEIDVFNQMTEVFFKASYYILMIAKQHHIPKVIFASSNHVTDVYESEGNSVLGREIKVDDYPYMKGLYGVLKLAVEQLGFIFSYNEDNLSIVNIRIGSVPPKVENKSVKENSRLRKTLLTDDDVVGLFKAAIESDVKYGTYYGVSDNPGKPWDTSNAKKELGFTSIKNINDIVK